MRRIAAIASVLFTALAITVGGVAAANAATNPGPLAGAAVANSGGTETAVVTCAEPLGFENSYGGGNGQYFWNATSSPYTLYANASATGYCPQASGGGLYTLVQAGTSRCLTVDTANRTVTEGSCSSSAAVINLISVGNSTVEVQFFDVTKACVTQDGRNSPVTYDPCKPGQTGDVWILF
jgi:hypothetical protein